MTEDTLSAFNEALASHNAAELLAGRNLALFYDTETTGLPIWHEPSEDPRQPHIVQLGALLVDLDSRAVLRALDVIVKPDGWSIPEDMTAIHGITNDFAHEVGIPEQAAITMLLSMWGAQAGEPVERIGHQESFDARVVRIGLKRFFSEEAAAAWKAGKARCTASMTTKIVKCPPTAKMIAARRGGQFKTPNLTEAYTHFFGRPFEGAHGAGADTQACMEVFFAVQDLQRAAA